MGRGDGTDSILFGAGAATTRLSPEQRLWALAERQPRNFAWLINGEASMRSKLESTAEDDAWEVAQREGLSDDLSVDITSTAFSPLDPPLTIAWNLVDDEEGWQDAGETSFSLAKLFTMAKPLLRRNPMLIFTLLERLEEHEGEEPLDDPDEL
jgi:hypothetical protein